MRDILFRGKRVDNGEWVYGSLVHRTKYYGDTTDKWFVLHGGEFDCDYYDAEEVLPDTIGQYTGLKDKNGNRLYEKDIVNCKTKSYLFEGYTIEWYNDDARFVMVKNGRRYAVSESFEYEIVGNITDNSDMLTNNGE